MHTTSIYDTQGTEVNRLEIDDDLIHCGGRVWKGNKHYYKGLGIPYSHHQLLEKDITDDSEFDMIQNTNIFYCLLYTSPSPRDSMTSRMPSSA